MNISYSYHEQKCKHTKISTVLYKYLNRKQRIIAFATHFYFQGSTLSGMFGGSNSEEQKEKQVDSNTVQEQVSSAVIRIP